jgi:hypothetical protein
MTARAALCDYLLKGKVLNVKNCFTLIGLTNASREISRMIETPFQVIITRTNRTGKSRFGQAVVWVDYRLHPLECNKEGIEKMKAYLASQTDKPIKTVTIVKEHTRNLKKEPIPQLQNKLF